MRLRLISQRNIIWNSKNDGYCLSITTQSGKSFIDPLFSTINVPRDDISMVIETPRVQSEKATSVDHGVMKDKGKGKVDVPVLKTIP